MRQERHELSISTRGRGLYDVTDQVRHWVSARAVRAGLLTLFIRHTSASLLVQENYDPEVQRDLERFFAKLVRDGDPMFEHTIEGPDDMPAHVRAALTQTNLSIPVVDGELALGTWQGLYVYEHRTSGHDRRVLLHLIGD
ncbi:MAG: secondary thiamine-phosphate synthase enzyme YjbQ [Burkholderiales bacterium]|jgi:secondary thiamine-phosphate synthase enzyme